MEYLRNKEELEIRGIKYPIDTDFRTWISFEKKISTESEEESVKTMLTFAVNANLPICRESFDEILSFFMCGKKIEENNDKNKSASSNNSEIAVDFIADEALIYAAFKAQYGIDLRKDCLHWWDFIALFNGLTEEHLICKIMSYRTIDLDKVDKHIRPEYKKLKDKYSLTRKHFNTVEERNEALKNRIKKIQKEVEQNATKRRNSQDRY